MDPLGWKTSIKRNILKQKTNIYSVNQVFKTYNILKSTYCYLQSCFGRGILLHRPFKKRNTYTHTANTLSINKHLHFDGYQENLVEHKHVHVLISYV